MMFTASSVRTPVSAGKGGFRNAAGADACTATEVAAGASGTSSVWGIVSSLEGRRLPAGCRRASSFNADLRQKDAAEAKTQRGLRRDHRTHQLAFDNTDDIAAFAHTEDHHGHTVVSAHGYGRGVHDPQVEP